MYEVCELSIGRLRIDPIRLRNDRLRNDSMAKRVHIFPNAPIVVDRKDKFNSSSNLKQPNLANPRN